MVETLVECTYHLLVQLVDVDHARTEDEIDHMVDGLDQSVHPSRVDHRHSGFARVLEDKKWSGAASSFSVDKSPH